jgi:hypothetical protein
MLLPKQLLTMRTASRKTLGVFLLTEI